MKYEVIETLKEGTTFKVVISWKPNFFQRTFTPFQKCIVTYIGDEDDMIFQPIEHMTEDGFTTLIPELPENILYPSEKFFIHNI